MSRTIVDHWMSVRLGLRIGDLVPEAVAVSASATMPKPPRPIHTQARPRHSGLRKAATASQSQAPKPTGPNTWAMTFSQRITPSRSRPGWSMAKGAASHSKK